MRILKILFLVLILLLPVNSFGALVMGTNAGFVTVAPSADPSEGDRAIDGDAFALQDTLPADCTTVTEIGFWIDNHGDSGGNWEVGIYDDDGSNYPSAVIGALDQTNTIPNGNAQWAKVTGLSIDVSAHQSTLLFISAQVDNVSPAIDTNRTGSGVGIFEEEPGQTTLTDPFAGTGPASSTRIYAIYAVCTTDGVTAPQNRGYIIGLLDLGDWKEMMGLS